MLAATSVASQDAREGWHPRALVVIGALAALLLAWWASAPIGPGIHLDSVAYLEAARSLLDDAGLTLPYAGPAAAEPRAWMAHFPPGTSLALALPMALGASPVLAVRLLLALSAAALVGGATYVAGAVERRAAPITAALLLAMPLLWRLYQSLWSEALFLVLLVAMAGALALRPRAPLRHGALAALGVLVRHAGLAFVLAAMLWAARQAGSARQRIVAVLQAGAPGIALYLLQSVVAGARGARVRRFGWYGLDDGTVERAWLAVERWLLPSTVGGALRAALALLLLAAIALGIRAYLRRRGSEPDGRLAEAYVLIAACHLAFVLVARAVADPWIPLNERLLAPTLLPLLLAGALAVAGRLRSAGALAGALAAVGAWGACTWQGDAPSANGIVRLRREGLYFASARWCADPGVARVRELATRGPVWTNYPSLAAFQGGVPTRELPPHTASDGELREFARLVASSSGAIVTFDLPAEWVVTEERLARDAGLRRAERVGAATVWTLPDGATGARVARLAGDRLAGAPPVDPAAAGWCARIAAGPRSARPSPPTAAR